LGNLNSEYWSATVWRRSSLYSETISNYDMDNNYIYSIRDKI